MSEIILDVVPVYKNEMYPTKDAIYHFKNVSKAPKDVIIKYMVTEISNQFFDCDCVIILEQGKVIEILNDRSFILKCNN